jgi:hypothetical protein
VQSQVENELSQLSRQHPANAVKVNTVGQPQKDARHTNCPQHRNNWS